MYVAPQHPNLQLLQAQLKPGSSVVAGQQVEVTAQTNQYSSECVVKFFASSRYPQSYNLFHDDPVHKSEVRLRLRDDGKGGDRTAHDGLWYGRFKANAREDCLLYAGVALEFHHRFGHPDYRGQYQELPNIEISAKAPDAADGAEH